MNDQATPWILSLALDTAAAAAARIIHVPRGCAHAGFTQLGGNRSGVFVSTICGGLKTSISDTSIWLVRSDGEENFVVAVILWGENVVNCPLLCVERDLKIKY